MKLKEKEGKLRDGEGQIYKSIVGIFGFIYV